MNKVEYQEPVTKYEVGRWGIEKLEVYAETPKTFWVRCWGQLRRHIIVQGRTFDTLKEARADYIELLERRIEQAKKTVGHEKKILADYLAKVTAEVQGD